MKKNCFLKSVRGYGHSLVSLLLVAMIVSACGRQLPPPPKDAVAALGSDTEYQIGPLDELQIFVWRSEDLSVVVPVRPDGRISMPLIGEIQAGGKTVDQLSTEITRKLKVYIQNPVVSVIVSNFGAVGGQSVNVVGEVGQPASIPYRSGMTVLDVMVTVGGLSEFAAGNEAILIRGSGENEEIFGLKLESLLNDGNLSVNAPVLPGDVIMIPKSFL